VYRSFPRVYGGSEQAPDAIEDMILDQEFRAASAPRDIRGIGPAMLAPTLLDCGSEEQRLRFIPPTLRGDLRWCQGYSEPGAGSDLAALSSRAVLDGDSWRIDGHKIWTSEAQAADYMFGLFRTEPDASKHAGISYLLVDMRSKGIEVRPLRQMTGGADFNEVFRDVRIPADSIAGRRGEGCLALDAEARAQLDRRPTLPAQLLRLARGARAALAEERSSRARGLERETAARRDRRLPAAIRRAPRPRPRPELATLLRS
jgi:alkylation response protein AidB-like acyl-CoA dehydrogenase